MIARRIAIAVAILALIAVPYAITEAYYVNIASQILLYAIFALGLNILVGYAGLVSLGHAGLFGVASYAVASLLVAGYGHTVAILGALAIGLVFTAGFAALSLRATGISFIMITLALGEILWGLAYRWISLTNGDNGVNVTTRPMPFGIALSSANAFYDMTLIVFVLAVAATAIFVRSPFGAALAGTRDQPRRMNALGFHVWMIRFGAFMFSGLLTAVAGILYVYYNRFISPQTLALPASAEALLMVISGGAGTLLGPIVGAALVVIIKNVVSAYVVRWNFMLGAIFVAIVVFMPEGLVPGMARLSRSAWRAMSGAKKGAGYAAGRAGGGAKTMTALAVQGLSKSFGGLRVTANVNLKVEPGERRLIIGPNGAGKTTLFNLITGELPPDCRLDPIVRPRHHQGGEPQARPSRHGAHLSDHHAVHPRHDLAQCDLGAARAVAAALESLDGAASAAASGGRRPMPRSSASASTTSPTGLWRKPPTAKSAGSRSPWRWRKIRKCYCSTSRSPGSPSTSAATCGNCSPRSRAT